MKNKNILIIFAVLTFWVSGCEKHDLINDWARIGQRTSHTYWEIPSSTVNAGNTVAFTAQFYNNEGVAIDHMEVWYDEEEHISMQATCPNVTFVFTKSVDVSNIAHVFQEKATYEFQEEYWNADKRAYVVNDVFPTSNTLKTVEWKNVEEFDQERFNKLFPDTFATAFQRDLYVELEKKEKYSDLRMLMLNLDMSNSEEFKSYTDSVFNDNKQEMEYWIKDEYKEVVKAKYDAIPFEKLIYNISTLTYDLEYTKSYILNAAYKVFDKQGNVGVSEKKELTLN